MDNGLKQKLESVGVDVSTTMDRFLNNEDLFLKFLLQFPQDETFNQLKQGLDSQDYKAAFEAAHTLKGVSGNLGLNNIYEASSGITEALRHEDSMDIESALIYEDKLQTAYDEVVEVIGTI